MEFVLIAFIVADAVAGFVCIRKRRYGHAIALGGIAVPVSMTVAAYVFTGLNRHSGTMTPSERGQALVVGFGALAVAVICVAWMTVVAIRARPPQR